MYRKFWAASLIAHIALLIVLFSYKAKPQNKTSPLTIKVLSKTESLKLLSKLTPDQVVSVEAAPVKDLKLKINQKLFWATHTQRTDQNQTVANKGNFQNSTLTKGILRSEGKGQGVSATDDFIAGATIGPMTILNSQEFRFASYYERLKPQIVNRWRPLIKAAILKEKLKQPSQLSIGLKITKLRVTINAQGEILGMEIIGNSGIDSFDEVAGQAFKAAQPFSYPPKELLKGETFLLRWDFTVQVEPAGLIQYKSTQGT